MHPNAKRLTVRNPELRWVALSAWIRAWDPTLDDEAVAQWARGLAREVAATESDLLWDPMADTVIAKVPMPAREIDKRLCCALARYAGIRASFPLFKRPPPG